MNPERMFFHEKLLRARGQTSLGSLPRLEADMLQQKQTKAMRTKRFLLLLFSVCVYSVGNTLLATFCTLQPLECRICSVYVCVGVCLFRIVYEQRVCACVSVCVHACAFWIISNSWNIIFGVLFQIDLSC